MAPPAASAHPVAVAVRLDGRAPYGMFELIALSTTEVRLRGPLLLELGEHVLLRLSRNARDIDVEGTITAVARDAGKGEPITTVELIDGAVLAPFLAA